MTASSTQPLDDQHFWSEIPQLAIEPERQTIAPRRPIETSAAEAEDRAARVATFPAPQARISRRIDWYVTGRGLPPLIADFLDTHWRSYTLRCYLIDGEESESCREAVDTMKDLAWSVHPKQASLTRRRLLELIPQLHERLSVGLESLGLGPGATEHDAFFAELAKLHRAALDP